MKNNIKFYLSLIIIGCFLFLYSFQNENLLSITAVGDMVFPYNYQNGFDLFKDLVKFFNSDINLGNLEGPITTSTVSTKNTSSGKMFAFKFSPQIIPDLLKYIGFHGVLVSNNHANDYGEKGFNDTIKYLKEKEIEPIGIKYSITQITRKEKRIGIVGFYYSSKFNDLRDLKFSASLVKKAKENNDFVIVFFHGGTEGSNAKFVYNRTEYFGNENRGNIFAFAHLMIDYGADLVLGSGPHILRGFELYKNKFIAYSLGNFVSSGGLSNKGELSLSCILNLYFDLNSNSFLYGNIIPIDLSTKNPVYDNEKKSIPFLRVLTNQIYRDNFGKNPDLLIDDDGKIIKK